MTLKGKKKKAKTLERNLWWTDDAWPRFGGSPNTLNVWWVYSPVTGRHVGEQFYNHPITNNTTDALLRPMTVPSVVCLIASNMFLQYESWIVTSLIWAADVINWPSREVGQRQTAFPGKPTFFFTVFQSPPAGCVCSMLAVWCLDSHDFPSPSPRRAPFCGGKGWFNSSQLRALQRCWQACLTEYVRTRAHVCMWFKCYA